MSPSGQSAQAESADAWYAIYTKHQHEKTATDLLRRKDFEVLLPLYTTVRRWKDRNKTVILPLFPSYLFVRTDLARKLDILQTPGVFWVVERGGRAFPVSDEEIEAVKRIVESPERVGPHPYLKCGDRVRIRNGALAGIEGILTRNKGQFRIVLAVELLQQAIAMEIDLSAVEPLGSNHPAASSSLALSANAGATATD
jgi:transcription elongation factor/antiterminator RfaH